MPCSLRQVHVVEALARQPVPDRTKPRARRRRARVHTIHLWGPGRRLLAHGVAAALADPVLDGLDLPAALDLDLAIVGRSP